MTVPRAISDPDLAYSGVAAGVDVIGAYHLLRPIGTGGMARVWHAIDGRTGREVAVKRMLPALLSDHDLCRAFVHEAEIGLMLRHPNIVEVIELGDHLSSPGIEPWLVLELLRGRPLIDVLRGCSRRRLPVPLPFALRAVVDAARGLDHAHRLAGPDGHCLGLVHRDVSPHNLFVCADGKTKLLDFGIAKTRSQLHQTRTGTIKGKFAYLAPEQVRGLPPDPRLDVFALGIVLYELLTCAPLFRGDNDAETLHRVLNQDIPPPERLRADVPAGVGAVAMRALQRDRERRLPSAAALADSLEAIAAASGLDLDEARGRSLLAALFPEDEAEHAAGRELARRTFAVVRSGSFRALDAVRGPDPQPEVARPRAMSRLRRWIGLSTATLGGLALASAAAASVAVAVHRLTAPAPVETAPVVAMPARSAPAVVTAARVAPATPPSGELEAAPALPVRPTRPSSPGHAPRPQGQVTIPLASGLRGFVGSSRRAAPEREAQGTLRLAAHPWAEITVDGRALGTTPFRPTSLPEGAHTISLRNDELGVSIKRRVTIQAGKETVLVVDLFAERR